MVIVDPLDLHAPQEASAGKRFSSRCSVSLACNGQVVLDAGDRSAMEAQRRCREGLACLDESQKACQPHTYPVGLGVWSLRAPPRALVGQASRYRRAGMGCMRARRASDWGIRDQDHHRFRIFDHAEMAAQLDIQVVTLYVNRNGMEYEDANHGLDAFYADIYDMVDDIPTSSQPSQQLLEEVFEDVARAGDQVCGIFISTGLSGAHDGALAYIRAARATSAWQLIDSQSCGFDEAFPVLEAVAARDGGEDLRGAAQAALDANGSAPVSFTPESLTFLQKGGHRRCGGAFGQPSSSWRPGLPCAMGRRLPSPKCARVKRLGQDRGGHEGRYLWSMACAMWWCTTSAIRSRR